MITLALLIPGILGFLMARKVLDTSQIPSKIFLCLALCLPIGFGIVSIIMFWSYRLSGEHGKLISVLATVIVTIGLIGLNLLQLTQDGFLKNQGKRFAIPKFFIKQPVNLLLIFIGLLLLAIACYRHTNNFLSEMCWNPFGGWDARYMWNLKAKFYARLPEAWADMFAHPNRVWAIPGYPHLLPASVAWGWIINGKEILVWPSIVGYVFSISCCLIIIWYLASQTKWWNGLIAGAYFLMIPAYQFWATTQYAEIPLSFYMTAASLVGIVALRNTNAPMFFLSGFLIGLSAWTKNEGFAFALIVACCFVFILSRDPLIDFKKKAKILGLFLVGVSVPILTALYLKLYVGGPSGYSLIAKRTWIDYLKLITDTKRILLILTSFFVLGTSQTQWLYLWVYVFITFVWYIISRVWSTVISSFPPHVSLTIILVFLIESIYFIIFLTTPIELGFHIQTSMLRLMLHVEALALVFCFEVFGNLGIREQ